MEVKEINTIAITAGILGSVFFLFFLFFIVLVVVVRSFRRKSYRASTAADGDITKV